MSKVIIYTNNGIAYTSKSNLDIIKSYFTMKEKVKVIDYKNSTKQRKVFMTKDEDRELFTVDDDKNIIYVPRGLVYYLPDDEFELIDVSVSQYNIDVTDQDDIRAILPIFDLRDDQVLAVTKALVVKRGVIQLPTGSGKTAIIAAIAKRLIRENPNIKLLVIVPTLVTATNAVNTFTSCGIDSCKYNKRLKNLPNVLVTHVRSIMDLVTSGWLSQFDGVFWDECHHLACDTWRKVNTNLINAEFSIGFSALAIDKTNLYHRDISRLSYDESLIIGATGPVLMYVPPSYYIEKGILAVPVVFRIKNNVSGSLLYVNDWSLLFKEGILSDDRESKVVEVLKVFYEFHRKSLVLVSTKEQAHDLMNRLVRSGIFSVGLSFGGNQGFSLYNFELIKDDSANDKFNSGQINILIATTHLDEGADFTNVDSCILAGGGKKDRRIIQRVGRALRKSKTGKYAYLIDFTDTGSKVLASHSNQRLNIYKTDLGVKSDMLYSNIDIRVVRQQFMILEGIVDD